MNPDVVLIMGFDDQRAQKIVLILSYCKLELVVCYESSKRHIIRSKFNVNVN